jgi:hypothetical protein
MKNLIYIFIIYAIILSFSGCDYIYTPENHYVSIYNNESDKYITAVYSRDNFYSDERWSKNMISNFIYPYDYIDLIFEEGSYDFRAVLEDDYYSYTVDIYSVYVYENISLDICLDCYDSKAKIEVTRIPKENVNKD